MKRLNHSLWHQTRRDLEAQIIALKHLIRKEPRPMSYWDDAAGKRGTVARPHATLEECQALATLKFQTTLLYRLRAHLKGKVHGAKVKVYKNLRDGTTVKEIHEVTLAEQAEMMTTPWMESFQVEVTEPQAAVL